MSFSPLAYADSLRIGAIDFVSPDEIKVLLDIEAPDGVALNTGTPRPFPRINGYVLIPSDEGHLVAQVEWITIERSQYPKRKGMQDFGLVDLPYPLRKMSLNPLGVLAYESKDVYRFRRGVESYPTVGDSVLLPTQNQLHAIVESGENRHVLIGTSPLAANAEVKIDPDRLFGRHLAILGNTGSGKSCSVAGLIRWSMDEARKARGGADPNARFIVLDPNGEYANTFSDMSKVRVFAVEPSEGVEQLQIPLWFWNSAEWSAFTQASAKTQRPTLVQALRSVRDGVFGATVTPSHEMRRYLRTLVSILQLERNAGSPWGRFPQPKGFFEKLKKWREGLAVQDSFSGAEKASLSAVRDELTSLVNARSSQYPTYEFTLGEVDNLLSLIQSAHSIFGGSDTDILPIDADVPRSFTGDQLLRSVEATAELLGVSEYVETMQMRIRTLLSDSRMKIVSGTTQNLTLDDWLCNYIGNNNASNGSVTVIDLSLVPAEVVHIITAVIARMTLEALQRYRKLQHGKTLPTVLVMEEAHTFIKRYHDDAENQNSAAICCQVFEKIAREGRKFGLGLVLSSQRPSELSPTVLSQCNSYLLHRISNDRDQELVHKLVPDNLRGLLRDLPSLPSRHAILLGWASELPVLVQMNALPEHHRPKSNDPDFWDVWSGKNSQGEQVERNVDWKVVTDDWQQISAIEPKNATDQSEE
ncbi:ATP-binding protein [Polynucleobacter sp. JS-Safj-400b-B2]|uniref:ATP-binding protein n=1 Tax=Polynucleobacter sp. JS-Safj-400b-B2 TaxID=2576921 RepID=UPI001C0E4D7F|nr:ATP-binding protein [Polynucleobacter sp. JS-Safj-400b-B2]MBU3626591.1 ATP-binding protein [Polynucleobacter sp. JS-Safj-400b-B2]